MAANEPVGNVTTMYLESVDQNETEYKTNISKGFIVNPNATYQQVDTAARALTQLTNNNYQDTILITEISVMTKMAE